jgi:exosome complex component MTR3
VCVNFDTNFSTDMKTGAVNAAAGSAYAEFGQTKVIVSVYGPRESKKAQAFSDIGRLNCDVKFASFSTSVRGKASQVLQYTSIYPLPLTLCPSNML